MSLALLCARRQAARTPPWPTSQNAQQKLLAAAQAGQFRAFYGNDYYDALATRRPRG